MVSLPNDGRAWQLAAEVLCGRNADDITRSITGLLLGVGALGVTIARSAPGSGRTRHVELVSAGDVSQRMSFTVSSVESPVWGTLVCHAAVEAGAAVSDAMRTFIEAGLTRALDAYGAERLQTAQAASGPSLFVFLFDESGRLLQATPAGTLPPRELSGRVDEVTAVPSLMRPIRWRNGTYSVRATRVPAVGTEPGFVAFDVRLRPSAQSYFVEVFEEHGLTHRESQIAALLTKGASNRAIATELQVSTDTVKTHCRHLFAKLGIRRRTELVRVLTEGPDSTPLNSGSTPRFGKRPPVAALWHGRLVRLDTGPVFCQNLNDGSKVRLEQGSVGYCYEASDGLAVGFNRLGVVGRHSTAATARFDIRVRLESRLIPLLSAALD